MYVAYQESIFVLFGPIFNVVSCLGFDLDMAGWMCYQRCQSHKKYLQTKCAKGGLCGVFAWFTFSNVFTNALDFREGREHFCRDWNFIFWRGGSIAFRIFSADGWHFWGWSLRSFVSYLAMMLLNRRSNHGVVFINIFATFWHFYTLTFKRGFWVIFSRLCACDSDDGMLDCFDGMMELY